MSPPSEVARCIEELCDWLNQRRDRREEFPVPVLAAVAHYGMTDIHPFAEGNGQMAGLLVVNDRRRLSRDEYEVMASVRSTAAKSDLAELVSAGVLVRGGKGPSTHTCSPGTPRTPAPAVRWTDASIERELREFCDGRST